MTSNQTKSISNAAANAAVNALQVKADAVFELADNTSTSLCIKLTEMGLATRAMAKPFALRWAAKKYHAKIEQGQRGDKLPRDSAADKAAQRVLAVCYGSDNPFHGKGKKDDSNVVLPRGLVKKLAGEIVAAGCTKQQFTALIAELRTAVTFS